MEFSVKWLKKYVDTALPVEELAAILTDQGLTVDEIIPGENDTVLDIDVTTNRPDAMNYLGLARELAASNNGTLTFPETGVSGETGWPCAASIDVEIADPDLCGRYVARVVRNVKVGPSPAWLQELLNGAGIRPINNIVDITNYVLWETGHPLHAFDSRFINGDRIIIRRANKGETLVTLDGEERKLVPDDLLIADAAQGIALAGVMGGENSEIREDTTDVIIESAWFDPVSVRKTSKRLALHTDASHRFERGADIEMAMQAADRAAMLIAELAGGEIAPEPVDAYPIPFTLMEIDLMDRNITRILGADVERDRVVSFLQVLGFGLVSQTDTATRWAIPAFRLDVNREIDLIEEVARMYGYNNLPSTLPDLETPGREPEPIEELTDAIASLLRGAGFQEAVTYSFCSPSDNRMFRPDRDDVIAIANPLTENLSVMRTSMLASMAGVVSRNLRQGNQDVRLFEMGRTYFSGGDPAVEVPGLAMMAKKGVLEQSWNGSADSMDAFRVKGLIEQVQDRLLGDRLIGYRQSAHPAFNPDAAVDLMLGGCVVGVLGELSESTRKAYEIDHEVVAVELDLSILLDAEWRSIRFKSFSQFPKVERDSAFVVDRTVTFEDIQAFLFAQDAPLLQAVRLFDRYEGKGVPEGKVSLAVNFVYQSEERTLNSEEVSETHDRIVSAFLDTFGASLR